MRTLILGILLSANAFGVTCIDHGMVITCSDGTSALKSIGEPLVPQQIQPLQMIQPNPANSLERMQQMNQPQPSWQGVEDDWKSRKFE